MPSIFTVRIKFRKKQKQEGGKLNSVHSQAQYKLHAAQIISNEDNS
jgi:hypothetical protein